MRIAVIGGTGSFGSACAVRLAQAGHEVVIGTSVGFSGQRSTNTPAIGPTNTIGSM